MTPATDPKANPYEMANRQAKVLALTAAIVGYMGDEVTPGQIKEQGGDWWNMLSAAAGTTIPSPETRAMVIAWFSKLAEFRAMRLVGGR